MAAEYEVFDGKSLSSLFKDIYENQISKKKSISDFIEKIRVMIKTSGDAAMLAPIIKDLVEVSVKNDEQLVKLATIAQRLALADSKAVGEDGYLSAAEKKQLLHSLEETMDEIESKRDRKLDELQDELEDIKQKFDIE